MSDNPHGIHSTQPKDNTAEIKAETAQANAEVAKQQAAQDLSGHSMAPTVNDSTGEALRKIISERRAESEKTSEAPPVVEAKPDATSDKADTTPPVTSDTPDTTKSPSSEDRSATTSPSTEDRFSDIQLPPNAKGKSAEAFASIKLKAAQEIAAREKEIEDLRAQVSERDEKLKAPPSEEQTRELEELRNFRTKFDIEADPEFDKFNTQVKQTQEFIYAQLRKSPAVTDETIEAIRKHGGPENVNMDKIFEKIEDPSLQRLVEAKLSDIEMAKFNKEQALKSAKDNVKQYVDGRRKAYEESANNHVKATEQELQALTKTPVFGWMTKQEAKAGATAEEKSAISAHNKFVTDINSQVQEALKDDSPQMRAILIAGMANFIWLQKRHGDQNAELKAASEKVKELTASLDKVKGASISRLNNSSAPPGAPPPKSPASGVENMNMRTQDALAEIRKARIAQTQAHQN